MKKLILFFTMHLLFMSPLSYGDETGRTPIKIPDKWCKVTLVNPHNLKLEFPNGHKFYINSHRKWNYEDGIYDAQGEAIRFYQTRTGSAIQKIQNSNPFDGSFKYDIPVPNATFAINNDCQPVGSVSLIPEIYANGKPVPLFNEIIGGMKMGFGITDGATLNNHIGNAGGGFMIDLNPDRVYLYFDLSDSSSASDGGVKFWMNGFRLTGQMFRLLVDIQDGSIWVEGEWLPNSTPGGPFEFSELSRIGFSPLSSFSATTKLPIPVNARVDDNAITEHYTFNNGTFAVGGIMRFEEFPIRIKGTAMISADQDGDGIPFGGAASGKAFFEDIGLFADGALETDLQMKTSSGVKYMKLRIMLGDASLVMNKDVGFSFAAENRVLNLSSVTDKFTPESKLERVLHKIMPKLTKVKMKGYVNTKSGDFMISGSADVPKIPGLVFGTDNEFRIGSKGLYLAGELSIDEVASNLRFSGLFTKDNCAVSVGNQLGFGVGSRNTKVDLCKLVSDGFGALVTEIRVAGKWIRVTGNAVAGDVSNFVMKSKKSVVKMTNSEIRNVEIEYSMKENLTIKGGEYAYAKSKQKFNIAGSTVDKWGNIAFKSVKNKGKKVSKFSGKAGGTGFTGSTGISWNSQPVNGTDPGVKVGAYLVHKVCAKFAGKRKCKEDKNSITISSLNKNGCFNYPGTKIKISKVKFRVPSGKVCI